MSVLALQPAPETDRLEQLRQLLLRGVLDHHVDLGCWISIDTFLIGAEVTDADLNRLTEGDLDEVRRRLQSRSTLLDRAADVLDRAGDVIAFVLFLVGWIAVYCLLCPPARAAAGPPRAPSQLADCLISLIPFAIAGFLVFIVLQPARRSGHQPRSGGKRRTPPTTGSGVIPFDRYRRGRTDEELLAYGDTTRFGEGKAEP